MSATYVGTMAVLLAFPVSLQGRFAVWALLALLLVAGHGAASVVDALRVGLAGRPRGCRESAFAARKRRAGGRGRSGSSRLRVGGRPRRAGRPRAGVAASQLSGGAEDCPVVGGRAAVGRLPGLAPERRHLAVVT